MMVTCPVLVQVLRVSFKLNFILITKVLSLLCAYHLRRMKGWSRIGEDLLVDTGLEFSKTKPKDTAVDEPMHKCFINDLYLKFQSRPYQSK